MAQQTEQVTITAELGDTIETAVSSITEATSTVSIFETTTSSSVSAVELAGRSLGSAPNPVEVSGSSQARSTARASARTPMGTTTVDQSAGTETTTARPTPNPVTIGTSLNILADTARVQTSVSSGIEEDVRLLSRPYGLDGYIAVTEQLSATVRDQQSVTTTKVITETPTTVKTTGSVGSDKTTVRSRDQTVTVPQLMFGVRESATAGEAVDSVTPSSLKTEGKVVKPIKAEVSATTQMNLVVPDLTGRFGVAPSEITYRNDDSEVILEVETGPLPDGITSSDTISYRVE